MKFPSTIQLGGRAHPLALPRGIGGLDVVLSYPGDDAPLPRRIRWAFGVLALCWAGKPLGWPSLDAVNGDVCALGVQVFNGLQAEGLLPLNPVSDLFNAIALPALFACAPMPPAEEQRRAEDFAGPPSARS